MAKFLVIDDSLFSRQRICASLKALGHNTEEAINGIDALEKTKASSYDCIFCDLLMPEMDGFEFLAQYQELGFESPVVVVSSDVQDSTKTRCSELGAAEFVNKPFFRDLEKMSVLLNKVLK